MTKAQIRIKFMKQRDKILKLYIDGIIPARMCDSLLNRINHQIKKLYMGV